MSQKSEMTKIPSEQVVIDIRRATRKHHSAEEKIWIVLDGQSRPGRGIAFGLLLSVPLWAILIIGIIGITFLDFQFILATQG